MTLSFKQARNLITATRTRRRYSHSLPGYLAFVLALVILLPSAAVLGIATCAGTVVAGGAVVSAHHADHKAPGPAFTPQALPAPTPQLFQWTKDGQTGFVSEPARIPTGATARAVDLDEDRRLTVGTADQG
jgi:hypothetical protein